MFETAKKLLPDDTCEHRVPRDPRTHMVLREKQPDDGPDKGFERIIVMSGAYNCSKPRHDPGNHGINNMQMWFILLGEKGATQWRIGTGWYTRSTPVSPVMKDPESFLGKSPRAWDIGYHARAPQYEGQRSMGPCDWLEGADCYYDGSSLRAEGYTADFLTHPGYIWEVLRRDYDRVFPTALLGPGPVLLDSGSGANGLEHV